MAKESFLFVPYHAGPPGNAAVKLSNSDARSHAAAVSRQRRDNKRLKIQAAPKVLVSYENHVIDRDQTGGALDQSMKDDIESAEEINDKATDIVSRRQHMRAMQFSWRAGHSKSPMHYSSGTRVDPFGTGLDSDFGKAAVDYFWQIISKMNQPVYNIFNVSNTYGPFWGELMMNDDYRPAGLAVVGAIMNRASNATSNSTDMVKQYQNSAVIRLHKRYSSINKFVADDITIMLATSLAQLAAVLGDIESHKVHRQMVRKMVDERGGLDALGYGGLVKCVLLQWDSFWTFTTNGQQLFSKPQPQPGPVYPAFPLDSEMRQMFNKLPHGFQNLIFKGRISCGMIELLGRVVDAQNSGLDAVSGNMAHNEIRKYTDFAEACPCLSTGDNGKSSLEKEICLAALLYCFNEFVTERSHVSLFAASRGELTRMLEQTDICAYGWAERECLVWACAVCINSWCMSLSGSELQQKTSNLFAKCAQLSYDIDVDTCLRKFFHTRALIAFCDEVSNTTI